MIKNYEKYLQFKLVKLYKYYPDALVALYHLFII